MQGTVYLLHFERPICPTRPCQHYLGWALDLDTRIADHRAGRGARLTQVALERGIEFEVVRTWPGDRTFERKLKHRKESPRLCPICFPQVRRRPSIDAVQLTLPLDGADAGAEWDRLVEEAARRPYRFDGVMRAYYERQRTARRLVIPTFAWDADLL